MVGRILAPTRRGLLGGLFGLVATPAVVKAESLMKISVLDKPYGPCEIHPGWFECNGATLYRDEFQDLYKIIGHTYGGKQPWFGRETFRLPDLRGRTIPGRTAEFNERMGKRLAYSINVREYNGQPTGEIRTLLNGNKEQVSDTKTYFGSFSGYQTFPPSERNWMTGWQNPDFIHESHDGETLELAPPSRLRYF